MTWYVRHRPKDDTRAEAIAIAIDSTTPAAAVEQARTAVPEGNIITSVAPS